MKKENKKTGTKSDTNISSYLLVFALVLVLGGGTLFFLYRPSKPKSSTKITSVEDNFDYEHMKPSTTTVREEETPAKESVAESKEEAAQSTEEKQEAKKEPTEYMKVSVDTDSETKTKNEQQKAKAKAQKAQSEAPKSEKTESTDKKKEPASNNNSKTENTGSSSSSSGRDDNEPKVVNYYYTDKNGNQVQSPSKSGETVYIIDKGSESTSLSDEQIRTIIDDYLRQSGSDQVVGSGTDKDLAQNIANSSENQTIDITGEGGNAQNADNTGITDITGTDGEDTVDVSGTQSSSGTTSTSKKKDNFTTPDYAGIQVIGRLWADNYGRVTANSLSVAPSRITSIEWHERRIGGEAYLIDTNDIFTKEVYVSDGAALEVFAIATYKDGATRTSNTCVIKHKTYLE